MVKLKKKILDDILLQALKAYPEEACGILTGRKDKKGWEVSGAVAAENITAESRQSRYEIPPEKFIEAERASQKENMEVIGFYHSHPDFEPVPSRHDLGRLWHEYLYIILSTNGKKMQGIRAWQFKESLIEEKIIED